ncbi:MAG: FlgD immunoglobulin-like domain containing protein [Bacteroidota bacterium]
MKKLLTLLVAAILSTVALAQTNITVTMMVDVSNYTVPIVPAGIRIAGNFQDHGATTNGVAMPNWSPTDSLSAMTDMGNGIWRKVVQFPITALGDTLNWKFVNGNWGANEGAQSLSSCGIGDGFGGFNRSGPIVPVTVKFCWDECTQCDGSSPIITSSIRSLTQSIKSLSVYPNPFNGEMNISYENARSSKVSVEIVNLLGQSVKSLYNGQQAAGQHELLWDATANSGVKVPFGTYFVRQVVDGKTSIKKVIYNR